MFLQKASSDGEAALAQLSQIPDLDFPADLVENTWTALYNKAAWAAIVFAIASVAALVLVFIPPIKTAWKRMLAIDAIILGVLMLVIGIFSTLGALDDADTLEAGFAAVAAQGAIPEAYAVAIGFGWYLLVIAGLVVAVGGILSVMAESDNGAAA
jgi:hypothetical protein